jgi:hypothetical protein
MVTAYSFAEETHSGWSPRYQFISQYLNVLQRLLRKSRDESNNKIKRKVNF